ncbi:MAG: tetraacyldisaccharide 4'-kinase [Phycisphaerales bacterium]
MARNQRPPLPALGTPLEPLYRAAVNKRNRDFDNGRRIAKLPIPVVSVGNISVGGTGKTPMVRWIVNTLRDLGANPGIAMRGYGRKHAGVSDEQQEHADRMPDTPIAANPDRVAAIHTLIEQHRADCAVLDDGFQHRFAARDLDIVLIDATRSPFADRCLPAGWLREPVESLARAHAIVITRSTLIEPHALSQLDRQLRARRLERAHRPRRPPLGRARDAVRSPARLMACQRLTHNHCLRDRQSRRLHRPGPRPRCPHHRHDHPPRPSPLDTPRRRPHPESGPTDYPAGRPPHDPQGLGQVASPR